MRHFLWIVFWSMSLFACTTPRPAPGSTIIATQTSTTTPTATFTPTPTETPEPGWAILRAGLQQRDIDVFVQNRRVDHLFLLRIDPKYFEFKIAYDATHPKKLATWQKQTGALIVFNGGFFSIRRDRYLPDGLLVIDGRPLGSSYSGFGGMFAVTSRGPELRWLVEQPYLPGEPLAYALQSFPVLVKPGGVLGFPAEYEDNMIARRTVLARDTRGRFVVLVTASSYFTLHRLSTYLTSSDLHLDMALNLDGGPSTGLVLAEPYTDIPASSLLPVVIAVFPR